MKDIDFNSVRMQLDVQGFTIIPRLLSGSECLETSALYRDDSRFYTYTDMREWGDEAVEAEYKHFGKGDADFPETLILPELVEHLRETLYEGLFTMANLWANLVNAHFGENGYAYPRTFKEFKAFSAEQGLTHPFSAIIQYEEGKGNAMHQDQSGKAVTFPFQCCVLLNDESEFEGGRFILQEEGKAPQYIDLKQGDAIIFPSEYRVDRWHTGKDYEVTVIKHGVEPLKQNIGEGYKGFCRTTLAIGFHGRPAP